MLENNVIVEETMENLAEDVLRVEVPTSSLGKKIAGGVIVAAVVTGVVTFVTKVVVPAIKKRKANKVEEVVTPDSDEEVTE